MHAPPRSPSLFIRAPISRLAPRSLLREQAGLTGVESDVGRHLTQFLHEKRVRGELKKTGEEERAACAIMVCRQGV